MSRSARATILTGALLLLFGLKPLATAEEDTSTIDGRTAAEWAADLASDALDARRKAAFTLWNFGTRARPHVRALATALRDDDEYVRTTVEKVLVRFEWQKSINTLSTALPELIEALGDERTAVRMAAVGLVWRAGPVPNVQGGEPPPKTLLPALVKALGDEDANVRANAAASLANLTKAGAPALPALEKALGDEDAKVRMWSLRALSWIDAAKSIPAVLKLANDADDGVRIAICEALAGAPPEHGDAALQGLQAHLADKSEKVRLAAVNGLWSLARVESLPALARALKNDTDTAVRSAAANALGGTGDPAAVPHLLAALKSSDETVLAGAAGGLCRLGPEGAAGVPRMIELLETGSPTLKRSVALSIGMLREWAAPALPVMVKLLEHEDAAVRSMAASSLSGMAASGVRSAAFRAAAIKGLEDSAQQVRQYCSGIVASLGPDASDAVPSLLGVHARKDDAISATSIYYALQSIGPAAKEALPLLRKSAAEPAYDRTAAAAALACVSEDPKEIDGAIQVLIDGMTEESDRYMAILRLGTVGPRARRAAFVLRVWMKTESNWRLSSAAALLRIEGAKAEDAAAILRKALDPKEAGPAMSAVREIGPEGQALVPALLVHAQDPASNWRTGALLALIKTKAHGADVREAFALARKDKSAYVRTLGARGLIALDKAAASAK